MQFCKRFFNFSESSDFGCITSSILIISFSHFFGLAFYVRTAAKVHVYVSEGSYDSCLGWIRNQPYTFSNISQITTRQTLKLEISYLKIWLWLDGNGKWWGVETHHQVLKVSRHVPSLVAPIAKDEYICGFEVVRSGFLLPRHWASEYVGLRNCLGFEIPYSPP